MFGSFELNGVCTLIGIQNNVVAIVPDNTNCLLFQLALFNSNIKKK